MASQIPSAQAEGIRELVVGIYANEPKISLNASGQPSGILGDLLVEIARQEGWKLHPFPCKWEACIEALQTGQIDLLPDMAYTPERAQLFDFHHVPALHSWSQLYRNKGVAINSMLDLQDKRVAVVSSSVQQQYLEDLLPNFGVHTSLIPVESIHDAFEKVAHQEVDAVATNRFTGELQAPHYQLLETPLVFLPSKLYYVTEKGRNPELLATIDRYLLRWQAQPNSIYFNTLERWMGAPAAKRIPVALWWSLATLGGLLLLALTGASLLRRQVTEKTRQLRESENRLNTILDSVEAYIYIKGTDYRYQYANGKVCELLGQPVHQIIGREDGDFLDAKTASNLRENDRRVLVEGERIEVEETNRDRHQGNARTFLSVKLPLRRPDGEIYALCGVSTDITRQKKAEEAIQQLAFYDPLTQLPNRRLLQDHLHHALAAHSRHLHDGALLFIDLDNFKDLNDTQGHDLGDQLLIQIADRLRTCTREEDTVARLGGDEFVVMLQELSAIPHEALSQAECAGQKIHAALSQPYDLAGHIRQCSVSIGIAMFSDSRSNKENLLKHADMAMYQAKADGRNTLRFFNPAMQAKVTERAEMEADLREGLAQSQFQLHYQPQVNAEGDMVGVEALVRWQHPTRGTIAPDQFIPVAETSGLILPLGNWILQAACEQLAVWSTIPARAAHTIAVNMSAHQLRHPHFAENVLAILKQTGARPECLKLELTESQLIDDVESVIAKMERLTAAGVSFSLDDFGTGYSSLSFLKRLPLYQLKIDRSFIRDLLTDPDDAAIVKAILTLGQSLSLDVIAEGVEDQEQLRALQDIGCRYFQGYLLGRPVPAEMLG